MLAQRVGVEGDRTMKRIVLALVLLLGFGAGGIANAAQVEITYNLQTTYTLVGIGELGPSSSGSMTVEYPVTANTPLVSSTTGPGGTFSGVVIPHGPIHISLLTLPPIFVNVSIGGDIIMGTLNPTATGINSIFGSLMSTGALTFGPFNIWDLGSLHCTGATCTALGFTMQSVPQMFTIGSAGLILSFPNVGTTMSGVLNTMFSGSATIGSLFGYNVSAATSGQEIGRHLTPEPSTGLMLGLGLGGLGLLGARARRVRR